MPCLDISSSQMAIASALVPSRVGYFPSPRSAAEKLDPRRPASLTPRGEVDACLSFSIAPFSKPRPSARVSLHESYVALVAKIDVHSVPAPTEQVVDLAMLADTSTRAHATRRYFIGTELYEQALKVRVGRE